MKADIRIQVVAEVTVEDGFSVQQYAEQELRFLTERIAEYESNGSRSKLTVTGISGGFQLRPITPFEIDAEYRKAVMDEIWKRTAPPTDHGTEQEPKDQAMLGNDD